MTPSDQALAALPPGFSPFCRVWEKGRTLVIVTGPRRPGAGWRKGSEPPRGPRAWILELPPEPPPT